MPLQSSYQRKSDTVCLSKGSESSAPGISAGESVTSTPSVAISNKTCCFSRTLRSIRLIQNSMCSPESLVLRYTHLNSAYCIVVEWHRDLPIYANTFLRATKDPKHDITLITNFIKIPMLTCNWPIQLSAI